MPELPSGTVTFLFTDIEGSTRLLHELGDGYADALSEHRRLLREAFDRHDGVEVDTQGDAFFVAFPRASDAVAAAEKGRRALEQGPIRVRMGVHTGEPTLTEEGYVGLDVHKAARIASCGHGGQVLLSEQTARLVEQAALRDLGEHRLKDLSAPERIYQLGDGDFPPLKTLYRTNLPIPATLFLGRERELAEVTELLSHDDVRLLTLTGPGGTGKTRLALQSAAALADRYADGVWWVPLASLSDPQLVLEQAARALESKNGLPERISDKSLLCLFDNFEHVTDAAPALAELLAACPNLNVLVTSREPLRLSGEREYPVPSLEEEQAVALFLQRAASAQAAATVHAICRRLDCLPLAVELAAARTRALSAQQILDRLEQRLPLLTGGPRDLPERQQTLRATIEWSHDLLDAEEQHLFARLAVFTGGCTLEAAETVCEANLDTLQLLLEKNLVRTTAERFWMLETIREYAVERLVESGGAEELKLRHAEFFLALAKSAHLTFEFGDHHPELVAPEIDNLRAAMAWARTRDPALALRIATALEMLWNYTNPSEGLRWYEELLEGGGDVSVELRAHALLAYASVASPAGEDALAERLYGESLRAFEEIGDRRSIAHLLMRLGHAALYRGDVEWARELGAESLELCTDPQTEALALGLVGEVECRLGNEAYGMESIAKSAELAGEIGFAWQRTRMLRRLADWELDHGDTSEADGLLRESLRLSHELGDRISVVFALARLARLATENGQPERAGRLWGAVEAEEEGGALGAWYDQREKFAVPVLAHAGPEFEQGREEGRTLTLDEAVELALRPDPGS